MAHIRSALAGGGLAVALVVVGSHFAGQAQAADPTPVTLPSDFDSQMAGMGITFSSSPTSLAAKAATAALSASSESSATQAVDDGFGAVIDPVNESPAVQPVNFTDANYGTVKDSSNGKHTVIPDYVNQPALMVVYTNTPIELAGPPGTPNGAVRSTFVVFVDPATYQVLRAVSYSTDPNVIPDEPAT